MHSVEIDKVFSFDHILQAFVREPHIKYASGLELPKHNRANILAETSAV